MIGLVLVTHGALANALRDAMEHVVGKQKNLATVCIESDAEFILLTDMFGGTPSNLAMSLSNQPGVEIIGGVNLPMLIKLAKIRGSQALTDAVQCAETAGRKYICSGHAPVPTPVVVRAAE